MTEAPALPPALRERYRVLGVLGAGGFGTVLQAEDLEFGRTVALKLLHDDLADEESRKRFAREARVTAALRHPHVVPILDFGSEDGRAYIVYEYVAGRTLSSWIGSPPDLEDLARWGAQLAAALQEAHEAGVLHRDVKPDNVLIRDDLGAVLCDFGIARSHRDGTLVTPDGLVLGTPRYMAPEVLSGSVPDRAADQFGLAATLAHVACGAPVYGTRVSSLADQLDLVRRDGPLPPLTLPATAPPGLAAFLDAALAWDPAERLADMATAARILRGEERGPDPRAAATLVLGSATREPPPSRPEGRRSRAPWLALAVLVALGIGVMWPTPSPPAPATPAPAPASPASRPWEPVQEAIQALAGAHQEHGDPDGWPVRVVLEHSLATLEDLGALSLVRRTWTVHETLAAWSAGRAPPQEHSPEYQGWRRAAAWLEHPLADLAQVLNRGRLTLNQGTLEEQAQRDRLLRNRQSLSRRAEAAYAGGLPSAPYEVATLGILGSLLPLERDPEILSRVLETAEAGSGPLAAFLAERANTMASSRSSSPGLAAATRRRVPRAALQILERNLPPPRKPEDVNVRMRTVNTFLRLVRSDQLLETEGDDEDFGYLVQVTGALAETGFAGTVQEALRWDPEFLDPLPMASPFHGRPVWREGLARLRQLADLEGS